MTNRRSSLSLCIAETLVPPAPVVPTALHLLLVVTLAYRIHGTPESIKCAAYRAGKKMPLDMRNLPAMFIRATDPVRVVTRGLEFWEDEPDV